MSGFPGGSGGKESAYNAGALGSVLGQGSSPGEGNGNPLQYFCVENSTDREAWRATVHGVVKSQTHRATNTCTSKVMSWKLVAWAKFPGATSFMRSVSTIYHTFFFSLTFILHWRVVGLQCVSFRYTKVIQLYIYIQLFFFRFFPP